MSKKHFIELADCLKALRPEFATSDQDAERALQAGRMDQWLSTVEELANFCAQQNSRFNRERWLDYIAGNCGPNGGKVKGN